MDLPTLQQISKEIAGFDPHSRLLTSARKRPKAAPSEVEVGKMADGFRHLLLAKAMVAQSPAGHQGTLKKWATHLIRQARLAFGLECDGPTSCRHCTKKAQEAAGAFLRKLPHIQKRLWLDVEAAYDGDPAAKSLAEVVLAYPGHEAITVYRLAHELLIVGVPLLPRMMTEYAHRRTGIDIHPGARIGDRFFIDHGTGVVIGETTVMGNRVKLYQGVTLGALSFPRDERGKILKEGKRHPTIEDDVVIYAGATILGGNTVIGQGSVIGGNTWVTQSVAPGSKITVSKTNQEVFHEDF